MKKEINEELIKAGYESIDGLWSVGGAVSSVPVLNTPVSRLSEEKSSNSSLGDSHSFKTPLHENGTELKIPYSDLVLGKGNQGSVYLGAYEEKIQEGAILDLPEKKSSDLSLRDSHSFKTFLHENGTELKIPYSDLVFENPKRPLGQGTQGSVYLGAYKGKIVAVKEFPVDGFDQKQEEAVLSEAAIMASLKSDFVVQLHGVCMEEQKHCLVMEYVPTGDLYHWLKQDKSLNEYQIYRLAADIAHGLSVLHKGGIIHRDLKSLNVLLFKVNGELCAKISDFGLSVLKRYKIEGNEVVGSLPWLAPEILKANENCQYSEASDVYGLGMVIYELVTKKVPYYDMPEEKIKKPSAQQIREWVLEGKRPWACIPESCPVELSALIRACCAEDPKDRPSADKVFAELASLKMLAQTDPLYEKAKQQMSAPGLEKKPEKTFIFENYFAFYKSATQNKSLPASNPSTQPQNDKGKSDKSPRAIICSPHHWRGGW